MELDYLVDNICKVYADASESELSDGKAWYHSANRFARGLASKHNGDIDAAAGIIAALSPQVSWERNQLMATSLYMGRNVVGQSGINVDKAKRIYSGEHPLDVLGGMKTRSFYHCIAYPGTTDNVTIDRHTTAIALGEREAGRTQQNFLRRKGNYELLVRAYQIAGYRHYLTGSEMQAVTWLVWRDRHGEFYEDTSQW